MSKPIQANPMTPWQLINTDAAPVDLSRMGSIPLELDPRWLQSRLSEASQSLRYFTLGDTSRPLGFAPFLVHRSALSYCLGEATLFSIPVKRYAIRGAPLCDDPTQIEGLFEALRKAVGKRGVVFFEAIPVNSPLGELLGSPTSVVRQSFHVVPYGPAYARRLIELASGSGFDDYMATLGSSTRRDVRRTRRDFQANADGEVKMTRYTQPHQAEELSCVLEQVSHKTYQHHLLGIGLKNTGTQVRQFRLAAAEGWLRAYVLWVGDTPVAFQLGYRDGKTYYGHHVGYDPAISKLQPGIYLHTELMADLLANGIFKFDFLSGDSLYKQRMSNTAHDERHYYLIPRGWPGSVYAGMLVMVNSLSGAIGRRLEASGLKGRVRRWIRGAAVRLASLKG